MHDGLHKEEEEDEEEEENEDEEEEEEEDEDKRFKPVRVMLSDQRYRP